MPRSYVRITLHTVFATKYRQPFIDADVEQNLWNFMIARFKDKGVSVMRINGCFDHVHIVHNLPRTKSIAEIVKHVKQESSRWIKSMGPQYRNFKWQEGYGCFSSDYRKLDELFRYVDQQKKHHYGDKYDELAQQLTFKEEYGKILAAYGFGFDWEAEFPEKEET